MPPLASIAGHRLQLYGFFSTILVSAVIASAFHKHSNFYSATVFLSRSSASVMVLANYGVLLTLLFGRVVQRIFFGRLTNQEVERLYDRTWFFLTESLLAFTIFRDEFDTPFVVMFGVLLFLKCFHWLISDRIDWMDQQPYPGPPTLFHVRTNAMFLILFTIDALMLDFAIESVLTHGVGGIVLFGSEYAILLASCFNSIMKYLVMVYDLRRARNLGGEDAPVWENKSMYMFYIELVTDFLKLSTYLTFFMIVMTFFGLPLNIIRDVYMTGVSFYTRFRDLLRYRAATKDMDTKYPDATPAELEAMSDRTCIICREEMVISRAQAQPPEVYLGANGLPQPGQMLGASDPPKKLHCGHVFHFQCLRSWLERQQSCPTCRRSVLENDTPSANDAEAARRRAAGAAAAGEGQANNGPEVNNQNGNVQNGGNNPAPPTPGAAPVPNATGANPPPQPRFPRTAGLMGLAFGTAPTPPPPVRARPPHVAPRAFQGFSVGGAWHAWDAGATDPATDAPSGTPTPTGAAGPSAPGPSGAASTLPTTTGTNDEGSSTGTVTPTVPIGTSDASPVSPVTANPEPAPSPNAEETLSPREAAAAAALRRLTGGASATSASASVPSTPSASTLAPTPSVSAPDAVQVPVAPSPKASSSAIPLNRATSSAVLPTIPEASASNSFASTSSAPPAPTPTTKPSVPTLIPLFDPSSVAHRPFINLSGLGSFADIQNPSATPLLSPTSLYSPPSYANVTSPNASGAGLSSFPFFTAGQFAPSGTPARTPAGWTPARTPAMTPARIPSSMNLTAMVSAAMSESASATQSAAAVADSGSLFSGGFTPALPTPSALTDESQIRRLDAWTRDAIDERLRVLEDVQRSLWKAAEDLQRVRSALPPVEESRGFEDEDDQGGVNMRIPHSKGKGKARAVDEVISPLPLHTAAPAVPLTGTSSGEESPVFTGTAVDTVIIDPETGEALQS